MAARGSREQLQRVVAAWLTRQAYEFAADRNPTHALFFDWRAPRAGVYKRLAGWSLDQLRERVGRA
jgi:hypothetical protein